MSENASGRLGGLFDGVLHGSAATHTSNAATASRLLAAAPNSPSQADEVAYVSGINADGTIAAFSNHTWNGDNPATYGTSSSAFKWGGSSAGTAGGTLTYYYDPSSNWTPSEQTALSSGLSMWSAVANVSFVQTMDASDANLTFTRGTDGDYTQTSYYPHTVGTSTLAAPPGGETIMLDTTDSGYGTIGSFSALGGYGIQTVLHEEGHFLGLDHGGAYNGDVDPATQQYGAFDNRMYSIMSYISPEDTSAKYYASNPIAGTNWNGNQATTWMPVDIQAVQRLYGVAVDTPLSGGQVFGYNTNITGAIKPYFDFTQNTSPVVTLWDKGIDNTLDLSGCTTSCTINLNPGTFSSFDGMTNNLAIASGTTIDHAIGGSANDQFTTGTFATTIDGGGGTNTVVFSGNRANYTLKSASGIVSVTNNATGVVDQLSNVQTMRFADQSVQSSAVCFAAGTRIRTATGEVAVESLRVGDLVVTASGGLRPIHWLGHRTIRCRQHPRPFDVIPIRIAPDAFGTARPARDLVVSPGHALCVDVLGEVLIPAHALVNGSTIAQADIDEVTYWHVELDRHDIILAENMPTESYLDMGNRTFFLETDTTVLTGIPDAPADGGAAFCRPYIDTGAVVDALRDRLTARALALGWTWSHDAFAGVHLVADGVRIDPQTSGTVARFLCPADAKDVWLVSDVGRPCDLGLNRDTRRLGICIGALSIDDGLDLNRAIPLDHALLCAGLHPFEDGVRRWTAGRARLPAALWAGARGTFFLRLAIAAPALPRLTAPAADEPRLRSIQATG